MKKWCAIILFCALGLLALAQGLRDPAFIASLHYVEAGEAPATPWSPTNVAGLQLWFRSEDLAGLATEGSSISNWPNAAPGKSTYYGTNATAAAWPLMTNTFNGLAGTNAVWFTGTDDRFDIPNGKSILKNVASCTLICVAQQFANSSEKAMISFSKKDGAANRAALVSRYSENFYAAGASLDGDTTMDVRDVTVSSVTDAVMFGADFIFTNSVDQTGGIIMVYTNNVLATNGSGGTMSATNTSNTDSDYASIGCRYTSSDDFLGVIGEIIVYVPAISAADRTNCWLYLSNKYALP